MTVSESPRKRRVKQATGLAGILLLLTAVRQELRKLPAEREWHGSVLGFVPYDLRPPTWSRLRASVWDPGSRRLFPPRAFGVGWSVNLAAVVARLRSLAGRAPDSRQSG